MKLSRSLRKTIAASLALTTFSTMLAGCGSNRGLTAGGLFGKGVAGDFLLGGLYGGVFGGFLRPGKALPKGAFVLELPRPNDDRLVVEAVSMDALRYYVHARICTEKLSRMNAQNSKPKEYKKLLKETAKLWAYAERFAGVAEKLSKRLAEKEGKPGYKPLAMIDSSPFGSRFFFSVAHAREGWGDERSPEAAEREDRERERRLEELRRNPTLWAQEICNMYQASPMGDKLNGLAVKLGTDAKNAKAELDKAMNTINKQGASDAKLYDVGMRTAAATKGTCQVALFVGGVVLSAPLLATGAAPAAVQVAVGANWYAGLVDTVVEGVNDMHIVATGDSSPGLDEMKKYTGTISALTSGVMIATSFSNFALMGEQAIKNTHDTLNAANLGTQGFLDSYNIGGAGVSAILDSTIWATDRGKELSEGKVFGFQVFGTDDGQTAVKPQEIPQDIYRPPTPIEQVPESELNELTKETEDTYKQEDAPPGISEADEDSVKDSGKDSGADSGTVSGEVSDDADFSYKKVIGATGTAEEDQPYYNIVNNKKVPYTIHWTHHFKVVGSDGGFGFDILDESEVTAVGYGAHSNNKPVTFTVVSYDSGTGQGKVKVKNKTFPFTISGTSGGMTITIEGFKYAEPKK